MGRPVRIVRPIIGAVQPPRRCFAAGIRLPGIERPDGGFPDVGVLARFSARIEALDDSRPFPVVRLPQFRRRGRRHHQRQARRQRAEAPPGVDLLFHDFRRLDLVLPDLPHGAEQFFSGHRS